MKGSYADPNAGTGKTVTLDSTGATASFRMPGSGVVYLVLLSRNGLEILPQPDWAEEDRQKAPMAIYDAYGYPDIAVDGVG